MNATCPENYGSSAELYTSTVCNIPLNVLLGLQILCISYGSVSFIVTGILLIVRRGEISEKKVPPKLFLYWSTLQKLVMIVRPIVIISFKSTAWQNLWHLYIVNLSATTAAGTVILFVYLELIIIKRSHLKKGYTLHKACFYFIYAISVEQFIVYVLAPIGTHLGYYEATYAFWVSTINIVSLIIPFFGVTGSIVYYRISKMAEEIKSKKSCHILTMVIMCTVIGMSVDVIAVITFTDINSSWIFVELAWIFFLVFNDIEISIVLKKKKAKAIVVTSGSKTKSSKTPSNTTTPRSESPIVVINQ